MNNHSTFRNPSDWLKHFSNALVSHTCYFQFGQDYSIKIMHKITLIWNKCKIASVLLLKARYDGLQQIEQ